MNQYRVTYVGNNGLHNYVIEPDLKTLAEIQDIIYAKGCVIVGATLYMAQHLVKIEML